MGCRKCAESSQQLAFGNVSSVCPLDGTQKPFPQWGHWLQSTMHWERREKFAQEIEAYCSGCTFFMPENVSCREPLAGLYQKRRALDKSCKQRKEVTVVVSMLSGDEK